MVLTRDISYFENIYDALHEDGDAELFLVKLEPKPVLDMVNQDLEAQLAEKEKLQSKKQDKRHSINLMILKIKLKTNELKSDLTELEKASQKVFTCQVRS